MSNLVYFKALIAMLYSQSGQPEIPKKSKIQKYEGNSLNNQKVALYRQFGCSHGHQNCATP